MTATQPTATSGQGVPPAGPLPAVGRARLRFVPGRSGTPTPPTRARRARAWSAVVTYLLLLAGAGMMLAPFAFSVLTSLKTPQQFATTVPLSVPAPVTGENYAALFGEQHDFVVPIAVTAQVALVLVAGQLVASVLAAYAFATLEFPGRDTLFWVYLSTLMVPAVVTIIPLYSMLTSWGLRNTFAGLVVPFLLGSPYATFLLRENFRSTPREVLDAATIDGAGPLGRLWHVLLPMNRPVLATLLLITVVTQWNSFMWPSIIAPAPEWNVITVATAALQTQYSGNWTMVMAATTVALAPLVLLFLVFQKQITRSIGITGVR